MGFCMEDAPGADRETIEAEMVENWNRRTPQSAPSGEAVTVTDALRAALERIVKMRKAIYEDVRSAHTGRGNGASEWMSEDDRDFRNELSAAFDAAESALSTLPTPPQWRPISEYDKGKGEIVAVLDWFMYRTDPDKKRHPVRYVAQFVGDEAMWCDNDGMELDIDPTHFAHLPPLPAAPSNEEAQS